MRLCNHVHELITNEHDFKTSILWLYDQNITNKLIHITTNPEKSVHNPFIKLLGNRLRLWFTDTNFMTLSLYSLLLAHISNLEPILDHKQMVFRFKTDHN